jgi:hypothetical protein
VTPERRHDSRSGFASGRGTARDSDRGGAQYAVDLVRRICREVGPGVPSTPQERKRAEIIRRELERYLSLENVDVEEFAFAPAACLRAFSVSAAVGPGVLTTEPLLNVLKVAVEWMRHGRV